MQKNDCCVYLRKSRVDIEAEARGEGETLARHEKALIELAKRLNLTVTKFHREVVSGETIASRPVIQQVLTEVEQGMWAGVLVMEVERLARGDTIDQGIVSQAFKYSGTKIITPMKTYDPANEFDEEYFEFGLFMSRREYKVINRRLQAGRLASVKEGKYVGNKPPYGYLRKKLEHQKGFTLEPHPEQADVVRLIFELYTVGNKQNDGTYHKLGVDLIARHLNKLKIPSQNDKQWSASSIRGILANPAYIGKIRWNCRPQVKTIENGQIIKTRPRSKDYILADGLHAGIIETDLFQAAQNNLENTLLYPMSEKATLANPLSGLIVCEKCGRKMQRRPYKNGYPDTLICPEPQCDNISSFLHLVEDQILKSLNIWLEEYKLKWKKTIESKESISPSIKKKTLQKLNDELNVLENQKNNIYDLLEQHIYDTDTFLTRSQEVGDRISTTKKDIETIKAEIKEEKEHERRREVIMPKVQHLLDVYQELPTPRAKNELLKEVLEKVSYRKDVGGRWSGKIDDFQLILYPAVH